MTIENRELYSLYNLVKAGYRDYEMPLNGYGLYIEAFNGGVTIYAKGKALYRKTFYGDNKLQFCSYIDKWQKKDGTTDVSILEEMRKMDGAEAAEKVCGFIKLFEAEKFNAFTVKAREFFKAVHAVDSINKGGKQHNIAISANNGNLDIASWNGGDFGVWQLDAPVKASGAVMVDLKCLDNIRNQGTLELSCLKHNGKLGLCIKGNIDAILPTMDINPAEFKKALDYKFLSYDMRIKKNKAYLNHVSLADCQLTICYLYAKLDNRDKAVYYYEKAIEVYKSFYGPKSKKISIATKKMEEYLGIKNNHDFQHKRSIASDIDQVAKVP